MKWKGTDCLPLRRERTPGPLGGACASGAHTALSTELQEADCVPCEPVTSHLTTAPPLPPSPSHSPPGYRQEASVSTPPPTALAGSAALRGWAHSTRSPCSTGSTSERYHHLPRCLHTLTPGAQGHTRCPPDPGVWGPRHCRRRRRHLCPWSLGDVWWLPGDGGTRRLCSDTQGSLPLRSPSPPGRELYWLWVAAERPSACGGCPRDEPCSLCI